MKKENFQALARLAKMRPGSGAYIGAMKYLVDGTQLQSEIAAELKLNPSTISSAVARIYRAELDAIRATR